MLHGLVQQLGTNRDTAELRGQCRCQMEVIDELREKIKTEVKVAKLIIVVCMLYNAGWVLLRRRTTLTFFVFFASVCWYALQRSTIL